MVWPAPALHFSQFFARFSSTNTSILSTISMILPTYSHFFTCISRIFFIGAAREGLTL